MIVAFDLDGTLANIEHRLHLIEKREGHKPDWPSFYRSCLNDAPIHTLIRVAEAMWNGAHTIEVWSGRSDEVRPETQEWLSAAGVKYHTLRHLTGWCVAETQGNREGIGAMIQHELRRSVRWIGKKRAHGRGNVVQVDVEHCIEDYSIERDGKLMRYMPQADGPRLVRPRHPYWSIWNRTPCCEIGDPIPPGQADCVYSDNDRPIQSGA